MDDVIEVLIEIPRGSRPKYEWDADRGVLRLDRTLYSSVHYPTDYGYIPGTHADDGDHLDVLVIVEEPTLPGCYLDARPIGVLRMRDDKGGDDKIIAVPVADPRFADVREFADIAAHWQREIDQFFRTAAMFCWQYAAVILGSLDASNERGMALFTTVLERFVAIIVDLNAGELLPA